MLNQLNWWFGFFFLFIFSALVNIFAGVLQDELFGQFVLALEKLRYFRTSADGRDDPDQLERATRLFHDALGV